MPTLVSTLAIACVFTSVVFLEGPARYLFTPLGLAVVFAMLASYGLSRTLTPITIGLLLKGEQHGAASEAPRAGSSVASTPRSSAVRAHAHGYAALLADAARSPSVSSRSSRSSCWRSARHVLPRRARLLSRHRRRAHPAARARAGRHAHRNDGAHLPGDRGQDPRGHSRAATASSSSTTSACRRAPTTSPSPTARPSASTTASSWWR